MWKMPQRPISLRNPDFDFLNHHYNAFGNRTRLIDAMGHSTAYTYDQLGRNTAITTDPVTVGTVTAMESYYNSGSVFDLNNAVVTLEQ